MQLFNLIISGVRWLFPYDGPEENAAFALVVAALFICISAVNDVPLMTRISFERKTSQQVDLTSFGFSRAGSNPVFTASHHRRVASLFWDADSSSFFVATSSMLQATTASVVMPRQKKKGDDASVGEIRTLAWKPHQLFS